MLQKWELFSCCVRRRLAENVELQSHVGAAAATVRSRLFSKAKVKSICMTAVIVAAFIICWTPYQVQGLHELILYLFVQCSAKPYV